MKQNEERAIADFRQTLAGLYLLRYGLVALTIWAFVFGTTVLALRAMVGLSRLDLLWGLASLPIVLAPAVWLALKRLPTRERVRAVLDHHGRCGGLLMAGAEQETRDWQSSIPEVRKPKLQWRGGWSSVAFALSMAFVAICFLVPHWIAAMGPSRLDINREVERLQEQLDVLQKEKIVEAERAEALKVTLDQLKRDASGKDPIKTIEALDHVNEQVKKAGEEAAEKANKKMEEMGRAQALNEALQKNGDKLNAEQMKDAMKHLAALMKKAAEENELLEGALDAETMEAIKKNKLTPEMLKKIAEALKDGMKGTEIKIAKLVKAKILDADALKKADKAGKCDCAALAAYLKENGGDSEATDKLLDDNDGKGGTNEGDGKSKLTFGDESTEDGVKYKEEELPPSEQQNLRDSQLSGISQGAPNIGKEKAEKGKSGALTGANAGGGSAATQTVLPRHKGAVERYFDRTGRQMKK